MSTDTLAAIRQTSRENAMRQREENRLRAFAVNREGIGASFQTPCSPAKMKILSETLKHKSQVNRETLMEISQGLAVSLDNAQALIAVQGSVHSLVTFLTGNDASLHLEAAYCLANLALWTEDPKCCRMVLQQASSYLVIFLSSPNPLLQQACVWVITNLLPEGFEILAKQGFLSKLIELSQSPHDYVRRAVAECFVQLVTTSPQCLREDGLVQLCRATLMLTKNASPVEFEPLAWLIFHFTTNDLTCELVLKSDHITQWMLQSFALMARNFAASSLRQLIPLLRCIGNLCAVSQMRIEASLKFEGFLDSLLALLKNPASRFLCQEVVWVIANIVNAPGPQVQQLLNQKRVKEEVEKYLVPLEHLLTWKKQ